MAKPAQDDPATYPRLGRLLSWVDRPGSAGKMFWGLAALCVLLFLADFTYKKYGHFEVEYLPGFFGFYGFVVFIGLIVAAKTLRILVKRPEDYYGDKSTEAEDYPADQLDKVNHNG